MKRDTPSARQLEELAKYQVPVQLLVQPSLVEYADGEYLCRDGMPVEQIQFLLSGRAKVFVQAESGENLILSLYDGWGVVDDMDLFLQDGYCHASCQAMDTVRCIALPTRPNREILLSSNTFLRSTCTSLAKAMQRDRNLASNILYPLENRLCSYIALTETPEGWNESIIRASEILGTSYRHLHRTLQSLCKNGILKKTKTGYAVVNRAALLSLTREYYSLVE